MSLGKLSLRNRWEKISAGEAMKRARKKVRAGGGRHFLNPLFKALLGALCAWHQDVMSQEVTRWNCEVRELPDEDDKSFWHFYTKAVPAWLCHEVTWTGHFPAFVNMFIGRHVLQRLHITNWIIYQLRQVIRHSVVTQGLKIVIREQLNLSVGFFSLPYSVSLNFHGALCHHLLLLFLPCWMLMTVCALQPFFSER